MYYQLSLQFATSEIDNAKKVLEYAKQLDIELAGLQDLDAKQGHDQETFAWEEEKPAEQKHPDTDVGEAGQAPQEEIQLKPREETKPEPAPKERVITLEMLQQAGANFIKKKGAATFKVLLSQIGATKVSNIPEEKYTEAWESMQNA